MSIKLNPQKKLTIKVKNNQYFRYPVKTHIISDKDNLSEIIDRYIKPIKKKDDLIVISERVVAIIQGRSFLINEIKPSKAAEFLHKYVYPHPGGIGLKSPWTMELAIREAGLWRIIFAAIISAITKPFGVKGLFYILAGHNINAIDGPCDYSLPPSDKSAKLPPKNPQKIVNHLSKKYNQQFVIIDANDYGVSILAASDGIDRNLIKKIFVDNPMGQSQEQTPIIIVRKR